MRATVRHTARKQACIHEAGHVVVGAALGVLALEVVVDAEGGGMTTFAQFDDAQCELSVLLAGRAAESLAFGDGRDSGGCWRDVAQAQRAAIELTHDLGARDTLLAQVDTKVRELLTKRWSEVQATVYALTERVVLYGEDLASLAPAWGIPFAPRRGRGGGFACGVHSSIGECTPYDRRSWQWRQLFGSMPPTPLDQLRPPLASSEVS